MGIVIRMMEESEKVEMLSWEKLTTNDSNAQQLNSLIIFYIYMYS